MRQFAALFARLDSTNSTQAKIDILIEHFKANDALDNAWTLFFLRGGKIKRLISSTILKEAVMEIAGIKFWLFQECYDAVGDLAETIALLLPPPQGAKSTGSNHLDASLSFADFVQDHLLALAGLDPDVQRARVIEWWDCLDTNERFVYNKLITGGFRVGVSTNLITRALAQVAGLSPNLVAHRLMGDWRPSADKYNELLAADDDSVEQSRPYPFFLASPIADEEAFFEDSDFDPAAFLFEWKWDGIRAQIIKRGGEVFIFSRGEELVTDQFPEVAREAARLPGGTVLDGEILAYRDNDVMPFSALQKRIGRKTVGKKMLEDVPVIFMAFDILEQEGEDLRKLPLSERRHRLLSLLTPGALDEAPSCRMTFSQTLKVSSAIESTDMEQLREIRKKSRDMKVEGLMLKRLDSAYGVGRKRGDWWKWKIDPFSCDAVLMYAQAGHGRRANLYTDYTFGVWQGDRLVPIAKAYSGLTDQEIRSVDSFIRANTLDKFGPVRTVRPELVFELAFEGIQASKRHKAGLALRFPRMARWRTDKKAEEADTLANLEALLEQYVQ